jgi:hypothetical protein
MKQMKDKQMSCWQFQKCAKSPGLVSVLLFLAHVSKQASIQQIE